MSLQEKLRRKELTRSEILSDPSIQNEKMKQIEHQNQLLLERMNQLTDNMNEILNSSDKLNEKNEKKIRAEMKDLSDKISELNSSNEQLSSSFEKAISKRMDHVILDIKKETDAYLISIKETFSENVKEIERVSNALIEKEQSNSKWLSNIRFYFTVLLFVAMTIVVSKSLVFGVWEGLYVKNIYEVASKWAWLKYTMWLLFAGLIGFVSWFSYKAIKENLQRP